jgi:hypothetical protein
MGAARRAHSAARCERTHVGLAESSFRALKLSSWACLPISSGRFESRFPSVSCVTRRNLTRTREGGQGRRPSKRHVRPGGTVGSCVPESGRAGEKTLTAQKSRYPPALAREMWRPRAATWWPRVASETPSCSRLAYAGLRPGEALALRWRDVCERTILIDKAASQGVVKDTKTRASRSVRLLAPLASDLRQSRLASGRPDDDALVFPAHDGHEFGEDD